MQKVTPKIQRCMPPCLQKPPKPACGLDETDVSWSRELFSFSPFIKNCKNGTLPPHWGWRKFVRIRVRGDRRPMLLLRSKREHTDSALFQSTPRLVVCQFLLTLRFGSFDHAPILVEAAPRFSPWKPLAPETSTKNGSGGRTTAVFENQPRSRFFQTAAHLARSFSCFSSRQYRCNVVEVL